MAATIKASNRIFVPNVRRLTPLHKDDLLPTNLYDLISAAAHVRPSQNTQERCAIPTHLVYDRFSSTPTGPISLFTSRSGSHSLFEQVHSGGAETVLSLGRRR